MYLLDLQTGVVAKTATGQAVSLARTAVGTGNIVVNTQGGVATNFAAINRRMSQATPSTIAQPTTVVGIVTLCIISSSRGCQCFATYLIRS